MTTNDDNQLPAYGERATPEQQRAAAGLPPIPFQPNSGVPGAPAPVAPADGAPSYLPPLYPEQSAAGQHVPPQYPSAVPPGYAQGYPPPAGYGQPVGSDAYPQQAYPAQYPQQGYPGQYVGGYAPGYVPARVPGKANMVWTIILLAIGLFSVINSTFSYLSPAALAGAYDLIFPGVSASFDLNALRGSGIIAAIVLWIGLALTTWFSWFMYKKQKYTWWIPLVGGVVFPMIAGTIAMGPVMDAITRYVS